MINILHSLLPDKKKKFPSDEDQEICGSCRVRSVDDIPDDIMEAARYHNYFFNRSFEILFFCRTLILKKEEEKQKFDFEECQKELQLTLKTQQGQIDRIESQIQLLLQLCSKK